MFSSTCRCGSVERLFTVGLRSFFSYLPWVQATMVCIQMSMQQCLWSRCCIHAQSNLVWRLMYLFLVLSVSRRLSKSKESLGPLISSSVIWPKFFCCVSWKKHTSCILCQMFCSDLLEWLLWSWSCFFSCCYWDVMFHIHLSAYLTTETCFETREQHIMVMNCELSQIWLQETKRYIWKQC